MVLQSNYARRASDAENLHPNPIRTFSSKRPSSLKSSIQSASRRRKARTTGHNSPRSDVAEQQAKGRSMTSSPTAAVRFDITREANDVEMNDTEMKDAEPAEAASNSGLKKTPFMLPRYLGRPDYKEIRRETIISIDPEFADVPLPYILEGLEALGPAMMQVNTSIETTLVKNNRAVPTHQCVMINDESCDVPTHMLAVYSRHPSGPILRVTLHPIHNIIMALHCAHLPMLPQSDTSEPDSVGQMILPVVPLGIPSPETFGRLSHYLYTKDASHLLATLLPSGTLTPSFILSLDTYVDSDSPELQQYSSILRATYPRSVLLMYAAAVEGLWSNVCALGVFDDQLWEVLDSAWEALIVALYWKEGASLQEKL